MQVISALAESSMIGRSGSETPLHIPYRDSKLTKLLMDSLVGLH
jgi:Kinesin motor domain